MKTGADVIEACEAHYRKMAETYTGAVRSYDGGTGESWSWQLGSRAVYYARDDVSGLRMMQALEITEGEGVTGRQYIFDGTGVYRVIALALTSRELEQPDLSDYVLQLHRLEAELTGGLKITDEIMAQFQEELLRPIVAEQ